MDPRVPKSSLRSRRPAYRIEGGLGNFAQQDARNAAVFAKADRYFYRPGGSRRIFTSRREAEGVVEIVFPTKEVSFATLFEYFGKRSIWQIYTEPFVELLAELIGGLLSDRYGDGLGSVLEAGAGDGVLAAALTARGVKIHPVDDRSLEGVDLGTNVAHQSVSDALVERDPKVVLASWLLPDHRDLAGPAILAHPSVDWLIYVGDESCCGSKEVWRHPDWQHVWLRAFKPHSYSRMEAIESGVSTVDVFCRREPFRRREVVVPRSVAKFPEFVRFLS